MDTNFESSLTRENLRKSFLEESALAARYSYFSLMAEFEGKTDLAIKLKDLSEVSKGNAHGILDFLREESDPCSEVPIHDSRAALDSVLQTEIQQSTETFGNMAQIARQEGYTDIASWFDTLEKLKRIHETSLGRWKNV